MATNSSFRKRAAELWRKEVTESAIKNDASNARDFCANERTFLTAIRLFLILTALFTALLLRSRLPGPSPTPSTSQLALLDSAASAVWGDSFLAPSKRGDQLPPILLPPVFATENTTTATERPNQLPVKASLPLGVVMFVLAVASLTSASAVYSQTHEELREGKPFAGSSKWGTISTIVLAFFLMSAIIVFIVLQRLPG